MSEASEVNLEQDNISEKGKLVFQDEHEWTALGLTGSSEAHLPPGWCVSELQFKDGEISLLGGALGIDIILLNTITITNDSSILMRATVTLTGEDDESEAELMCYEFRLVLSIKVFEGEVVTLDLGYGKLGDHGRGLKFASSSEISGVTWLWSENNRGYFLNVHLEIELYCREHISAIDKVSRRVWKDSWSGFRHMLEEPEDNCADLTIISKDGKEFKCHKTFLIARSPVFKKMFQTDMIEAKTDKLKLDDLDSNAVKSLLNLAYTGELLPFVVDKEDGERPCISEMIYLAHKYEIRDLLEYFDEIIPQLCGKENVTFLLHHVNLYSLSKSKGEIEKFVNANPSVLPGILEGFRLVKDVRKSLQ